MNRERGSAVVLEFPDRGQAALGKCITAQIHLKVRLNLFESGSLEVSKDDLADALKLAYDYMQPAWQARLQLDIDDEHIENTMQATYHSLRRMVNAAVFSGEYPLGVASVDLFAQDGYPCIDKYTMLLQSAYEVQDNESIRVIWDSLLQHIESLTQDLLRDQVIFYDKESAEAEYHTPMRKLEAVLDTQVDMKRKRELVDLLRSLARS